MNLLFLTLAKIEDINKQGIYTDLLRNFVADGHNVYVVSPREKRLNMPTEFTEYDNLHFLRVKVGNLTKTNIVEKGISSMKIEGLFLKAIKKYIKNVNFDLVLYSTPPITFDRVISYIKKRDNAKSYLLLKDIFPQNALDLNMFNKKSPIYLYFRRKERKLYNISDYIGCMSPKNVEYLLKHNPKIPNEIVEICPNGIDPLSVNVAKNNSNIKIRKKYNIPLEKTVFIYGGNLGKPQGIDFLIECLESNKENHEAYFVIVGGGTEYNKLNKYFKRTQTPNAQLLSQLPKEDYEILANSCDVGLIFLDKRFTIPNFPSRLLSYMHASMPVLAATDINTDIGQVIVEGNFGFWCESRDVSNFNKNINLLLNKKTREQMGRNARNYLEENYTAKHAYDTIMRHFE